MAKVSLRIYNREIGNLIEQGQTNEAIAHCQHILKTFPKHLETYRLLGKAFLESKRNNDAVDIFTRVLMAAPDDFVAHVGMSIIRDEENKLDDAIWHMERAFEVQPSNPAIQSELQRLYGRRDGLEPPKIRMTRGALANMYVQGELYPQAIAEIRAVLAQDPQRMDMQVLLARAFFKGGQKADASDMCAQLLKQYTYCLDANRIMVDLLPATAGAAESTQVYRMRVGELDPYAIFAKGSIFQSDDVPDASVNLERLEYKEEVPEQNWSASLGIGLNSPSVATSTPEQPDWLKSGEYSEPQTPSAQPKDELPDFLRAAGWGESSEPEKPTSIFDEEPAGELAPANLPDWLKGQTPQATPPPEQPSTPSLDTPDWLSGLGGSAAAASSFTEQPKSADVPDWLSGLGSSEPAPAEPAADVPDWLSGLGDSQPVQSQPASSAAPDWLSGLEGEQSSSLPASDVPDWLGEMEPKKTTTPAPSVESLGASAQEQDDAVAWLESLAAKHGAKPEELVTDPNKRSETPPEWVSQAQTINQQPAPSVESLGSTAQEQDDAVAWLESLAAKHGAKPEELVTDPNKRSETPPEWVSQAQTINQQPAPSVESLGSTAQEQDDAVAWLESLAAKHGAKPEELVTDPNKRSETPPEWVSQAQTINQQPAPVENAINIGEQFFAEFEESSTAEPKSAPVENAMNIGEQFFADFEEASTASTDEPVLERGKIPEWLSDTPDSTVEPKSDSAEWITGADESAAQSDISSWLSNLDDEPGLPFDKMPTPDSIMADVAANKKDSLPKTDLLGWLSNLDEPSSKETDWQPPSKEEAVPVPVKLQEDLPDWLQDSSAEETPSADEDTPPWVHREKFEASQPQHPTPTQPSDWKPVEPKSEQKPKQSSPVQQPVPIPAQKTVEQKSAPEPKKKKAPSARTRQPDAGIASLEQAKSELDRGDIPAALKIYGNLIKKGKHLDESIRDLTDSLYRYPVEVSIWQALGDAYMRANRLQEALEAYNKAEELIR